MINIIARHLARPIHKYLHSLRCCPKHLYEKQMRSNTGVGESKLKRFSDEFLAVIREAEYEG